jgi:hypothetical protein
MASEKIAVYRNKRTREVFRLAGVDDLEMAKSVYRVVCKLNGWDPSLFSLEVDVKMSPARLYTLTSKSSPND